MFPASELGPGEMRRAQVGAVTVVVVRDEDGTLHALRDVCAHMGARLSDGALHRSHEADPELGYRLSDTTVISCPYHGFEFAVKTGRCLADDSVRSRYYEVSEEDDMIVLER